MVEGEHQAGEGGIGGIYQAVGGDVQDPVPTQVEVGEVRVGEVWVGEVGAGEVWVGEVGGGEVGAASTCMTGSVQTTNSMYM